MIDPAPTPWAVTGSLIIDADGRLVAVLAGRLTRHHHIIAAICTAPEMYQLLLAVESHLATALPENLLLDEVRAMLDKAGSGE